MNALALLLQLEALHRASITIGMKKDGDDARIETLTLLRRRFDDHHVIAGMFAQACSCTFATFCDGAAQAAVADIATRGVEATL